MQAAVGLFFQTCLSASRYCYLTTDTKAQPSIHNCKTQIQDDLRLSDGNLTLTAL